MSTWKTVLSAAALLLVGGLVSADVVIKQEPLTWDDVAGLNGEQMYAKLCASCHGVSGAGDGPAAPALEQPVPDLTRLYIQSEDALTHAQVEKIIAGRHREVSRQSIGMPRWEQQFRYVRLGWSDHQRRAFANRKIDALADYVETLQVAYIDD